MKKITTILLIISLSACSGKKYKLDTNDLKWNPYKGNEVLIFKSNHGEIDTFPLKGDYLIPVVVSPYSFKPDSTEILEVYCNNYNPLDKVGASNFDHFITLTAGSPKHYSSSCFYINMTMKDASFEGEEFFIKTLESIKPISMSINNILYNDITIIDRNLKTSSNELNNIPTIYWSKKNGIVRFDLADKTWELYDKYEP